MIKAPWTQQQIDALNKWQARHDVHPYTCGGDRSDEAHRKYALEHFQGDFGILVATKDGWLCPVCGYKQDWAHELSFGT